VPFARYIARRGVSYLKHYSIDNVYRESRLVGLHPRELAACSFDIVTPASGQTLVADAEVVAIVSEIVHEVPGLGGRNCRLRVNHTALVKAVLLHCGVAESLHADIYAILGNSRVCYGCFHWCFATWHGKLCYDLLWTRIFNSSVHPSCLFLKKMSLAVIAEVTNETKRNEIIMKLIQTVTHASNFSTNKSSNVIGFTQIV